MNRYAHWQAVYESKAETEVSWFQEYPATSLALIHAAGMDANARIIDVGGGASRLVDHLIDQGCQSVTILDITNAALEKTRLRLGCLANKVVWLVTDVTQWIPSERYDIWHDRAVFHFLTEPSDRIAYATAMSAAVRTGGYAIVGTFAPDGPERCSGLPVCRYNADGLIAEFTPHFRLIETKNEEHVTPGGKIQRFQFCRMLRV
ncbi:MAG: class I SAM-dependent methyltransferase [Alphaproteobacteria bacterium]|nr:class I SAM-dependent methyltransferase [Alphaproteobacteria bacterium]